MKIRRNKVGSYSEFLQGKKLKAVVSGLSEIPELHPALFGFQRDIVEWALRLGKASVFADCGLGKTLIQLEWANHLPGDVLILAPLAVTQQTVEEARRFGIDSAVSLDGNVTSKITVANYERLHKFETERFQGIVLDESSIIKSFSGKIRNQVIQLFSRTPYRLACTATPAPNDQMELGNHAEFMGAMLRAEMLAMFFCHDGGNTSQWRLKGHAVDDFWRWVASWAVMLKKPSDLGYEDDGFVLPELSFQEILLKSGIRTDDTLFTIPAQTLAEQRVVRRKTMSQRVDTVADVVNASNEPWVVWCELNDEGDELHKLISDSEQVAGRDSNEDKERKLIDFTRGKIRVMVTKPKIAGHGLNWQHCHNMAFVGLSHSFEQFYQAVRRCWRFGQLSPVEVLVVTTDIESAVLENIKRKQADAEIMAERMVECMSIESKKMLGKPITREKSRYKRNTVSGEGWTMHLADSVDVVKEMEDETVDFTIFSPPFASLYTYSDSERDFGNSKGLEEFLEHFSYLAPDLLRVTRTGRELSFHCMQIPLLKERDGVIGLIDFRGELIRVFTKCGWIFHSEVCIWKDPVTQMQRTKALGLLHKQIKKDSCMSRQGIPDYLVTMRKPGENTCRVTHTNEEFPVEQWQRWASPVWADINPSDTLQYFSARSEKDERHIAPLQLEVIRRSIHLWTNPGELVFSPFAGIGSEGFVALRERRTFLGAELKESYWKQACLNLENALSQREMFSKSGGSR